MADGRLIVSMYDDREPIFKSATFAIGPCGEEPVKLDTFMSGLLGDLPYWLGAARVRVYDPRDGTQFTVFDAQPEVLRATNHGLLALIDGELLLHREPTNPDAEPQVLLSAVVAQPVHLLRPDPDLWTNGDEVLARTTAGELYLITLAEGTSTIVLNSVGDYEVLRDGRTIAWNDTNSGQLRLTDRETGTDIWSTDITGSDWIAFGDGRWATLVSSTFDVIDLDSGETLYLGSLGSAFPVAMHDIGDGSVAIAVHDDFEFAQRSPPYAVLRMKPGELDVRLTDSPCPDETGSVFRPDGVIFDHSCEGSPESDVGLVTWDGQELALGQRFNRDFSVLATGEVLSAGNGLWLDAAGTAPVLLDEGDIGPWLQVDDLLYYGGSSIRRVRLP